MKHPAKEQPERVLVVGRSPNVLIDTVEILRGKGFSADATNQFDRVLEEYDVAELDILVFGGMVPPDTKQHLREQVAARNPGVTFVQGLAGIAGLIAAQVEGAAWADSADDDSEVSYDAERRVVELTLSRPEHISIDAYWGTSFTPPEPRSTSANLHDSELAAGTHSIAVPDEVPTMASFVTVAAGGAVHAFTVGPMPEVVTRMVPGAGTTAGPAFPARLPPVEPVATHGNA
jgi:hypothetical protein